MARHQSAMAAGKPGSGYEDVFFSAPDGLKLHARDYGREDPAVRGRLPLVCLPGLSRSAADFHDIALLMARDPQRPRRVVAFDYRGRGASEWDPDPANYTVAVEAEDVLSGLAALGIGEAVFLGTSRGGLIMHVLAAIRPTVMAAGILNDIGPVVEGAGLAQIKAYLTRAPRPADLEEAMRLQRDIHGRAFPALTEQDWRDFASGIYVEKNGRLAAAYDPKLVEGLKDMDFSTPLPTLWPQFDSLATRPLLVLRGVNSSLLSEATLDAMKARSREIETYTVPGQGHPPILHLGELPALIGGFLARAEKTLRR